MRPCLFFNMVFNLSEIEMFAVRAVVVVILLLTLLFCVWFHFLLQREIVGSSMDIDPWRSNELTKYEKFNAHWMQHKFLPAEIQFQWNGYKLFFPKKKMLMLQKKGTHEWERTINLLFTQIMCSKTIWLHTV